MTTTTVLKSGFWCAVVMVALGAQVAAAGQGGPPGRDPAPAVTIAVDPAGHMVAQPPSLDSRAAPASARRILVRFRAGQGASFGPEIESARAFARHPGLFAVTLPPGRSVAEAVRDFRSRPDVLYAEPDYLASVATVPNDPRYSEQWSLPLIGAPEAWDTQTDAGDVIVAVIDTGVDFSHPELASNLWTDPVSGAHGFTFLDGVTTEDGSDVHGHGTHVAGVIGAVANNGVGIAGLNWNVEILSLAFIGANGLGSVSDAILAFDKIVELRQAGFNIRLSNNSWTVGAHSQALEDAVEQATASGVLHVGAAGNYVGSIDTTPTYPASFDGPGILAVNATDPTDGRPTFSGIGLARVDLAAPGTDILSTVPTGTCALCDPSGYLLVSGTSMAAPHVAGVLAAVFHLNPALQPAEARDVLLDPASYVALPVNGLASRTSTGGRLDFAATLANPLLYTPQLNGFPTATSSASLTRSAGSDVSLSMTIDDPDGDPLRALWSRRTTSGLLGFMLNFIFPGRYYWEGFPNPHTFSAPSVARVATTWYAGAVADGRGGSALTETRITVLPAPSSGEPPTAQLSITPTEGPVGTTIEVSFTGADPEGGDIKWGYNGYGGSCCFPPTQTLTQTLTTAGAFRFDGQSIDPELQLSDLSTVVVRIGGALGEPPVTSVAVDVSDGPVPLTVNWDASASYDPDGGSLTYSIICDMQAGYLVYQPVPATGSCTYDEPGPHRLSFLTRDESDYTHTREVHIMATLPIPADTVPPTVAVTAPPPGASVGGLVTVEADATDDVGVVRVEFLLDSTVLLGVDTSAPYSIVWDATNVTLGSHTLHARAFDQAGNEALSDPVGITVIDVTPPGAPTGLTATGGPARITLDWADSPESDLAGYRVYRSTTEGSGYSQIGGGDVPASSYLDSTVVAGTAYYYVVTAVDDSSNESPFSDEATAVADHVNLATADVATPAGTLYGSFVATQTQNDWDQELREELSGGKPANRYSHLEHIWQFEVLAGETYAFHIDAHRLANSEGDDFLLEYSQDGNSYAPMLTVTKDLDDDVYQVFAFPIDVGGTLFVRATDTDHTAGNQALDALEVDHMFVTTTVAGGPDVTPPNPPAGLTATPGDGLVSLDWDDNSEPDLAGYHVYRGTTTGGPYTPLNGSLLTTSDYADGAVANGTTYYYVVSAEDNVANESAFSQEASATPQAGGSFVHVDSIVLSTVGGGKVKGRAVVTVVDAGGSPVAGVDVTGTFSGDFSEVLTATSDASGVATLTTSARVKTPVSFSFCVDDLAHAAFTYDPASNVETCDQLP